MKFVRDYPIRSFSLLIVMILISTSVLLVRRNFYGHYNASVIDLALGFTARNLCSCYFVQERSEALCRDNTEIDQLSPRLTIHADSRAVEAKFLFWQVRARDLGPDFGCVLE